MIIVLGIDIKKFEMQNYTKINCLDFIFFHFFWQYSKSFNIGLTYQWKKEFSDLKFKSGISIFEECLNSKPLKKM